MGSGKFGGVCVLWVGLAGAVVSGGMVGCESGGDGGGDLLGSLVQAIGGRGPGEGLTEQTVAAGLKEALRVGTERAVGKLSQAGGYGADSSVRIEVPEALEQVARTLRGIGLGKQVDLFEMKMNEAAESAAVRAGPVFLEAIAQMSIADARRLLGGGQTAITDYFRERTLGELTGVYTPIVREHMNRVGAVREYEAIMGRYASLPLVPEVDFSPEGYVTERALEGLFASLAEVEREIRANPGARTTALLREVFGG